MTVRAVAQLRNSITGGRCHKNFPTLGHALEFLQETLPEGGLKFKNVGFLSKGFLTD